MKTLKILLITACHSLVILSCDHKSVKIISANDYENYLSGSENKSLLFTKAEIEYWQKKYDSAPNQTLYLSILASNYSKLFEITANINDLLKAEALLVQANETYKYSNVGTIRSLARNYISQHRFKEALILAKKAEAIGEGMKETQKLFFDVQMELGNYADAKKNLDLLQDQQDFDYLIRAAKWNDHLGDLKTTISLMEKAKMIAESFNNSYLKVWCYSNLGDYYGHYGNINKSYEYYLKTLAADPNNCYALKGIAWIAFSHDKNTKEAIRIVNAVSRRHNSPDFYLLKSQIAEYDNKIKMKKDNLDIYFAMLRNHKYGAMYNRYNALIYSEDKNKVSEALEIAKVEINHRPTPESYDLLAWSYFKMGDEKKALAIEQKYIIGKTSEPKINFHLAMIYKANNMTQKVSLLKEELLKSSFELGPNSERILNTL